MNQGSSWKKSPWKMPSRLRLPLVEVEEEEKEAEAKEDEILIILKKVYLLNNQDNQTNMDIIIVREGEEENGQTSPTFNASIAISMDIMRVNAGRSYHIRTNG
jgi:hypothetical protein